jgi:hypothetical protein
LRGRSAIVTVLIQDQAARNRQKEPHGLEPTIRRITGKHDDHYTEPLAPEGAQPTQRCEDAARLQSDRALPRLELHARELVAVAECVMDPGSSGDALPDDFVGPNQVTVRAGSHNENSRFVARLLIVLPCVHSVFLESPITRSYGPGSMTGE